MRPWSSAFSKVDYLMILTYFALPILIIPIFLFAFVRYILRKSGVNIRGIRSNN